MLKNIKNATNLFGAVLRAFVRYPMLLMPLILVWALYTPLVIYLYFYFDWESASTLEALAVIFGTIFAISVLISSACFMLLEQVRFIETGQKGQNFFPIGIVLKNLWRALPIVLIWASVWFLITIVEMLVRRENTVHDQEATPENIARLLGGNEGFSIAGAFFDALKKGIRMIAFLIFPAIAWENDPKPIRRGLAVIWSHKTEFASGFILSEIAAAVTFIPPAIVFAIADNTDFVFGNDVWIMVIIYCGLAWSFSLLIEQLFTAELYLWDIKWRQACQHAEESGQPLPQLGDVPRPSIMDDRPDLMPRK